MIVCITFTPIKMFWVQEDGFFLLPADLVRTMICLG